MAEPYRRTSTGNFDCPEDGVIEIITLDCESQNSKAVLYDGSGAGSFGRKLYNISALAYDSKITPILTIPYEGGVYVHIAGTGAGVSITVR